MPQSLPEALAHVPVEVEFASADGDPFLPYKREEARKKMQPLLDSRPELAAAATPVLISSTVDRPSDLETLGATLENAARLEKDADRGAAGFEESVLSSTGSEGLAADTDTRFYLYDLGGGYGLRISWLNFRLDATDSIEAELLVETASTAPPRGSPAT